jgi:integrase
VLREAKLAGIVRHNVLADAEPFGADPKRRDIFSLADLHKLFPDDPKMLASIWGDPERSVAFLLLASTGIRSGECRALRWLNVIGERALYVDSGLDAFNRPKGTKTETARAVLLPTKARTALALWRELAPFKADDDFIFSEGRGQPHGRNWLTRTLSPAMKRAGVETGQRHLVVHSFRHTFVSMMRASTSDEIAMAMSGHVTDKALDIYTHRNVQDLLARLEPSRDAIEKTLSW